MRDLKVLGLRWVERCVRVHVCVRVCADEVRSIPRGGGGGRGGGLCEEATYEEYNGLRQTRKGHKKL